MEFGNKDFLTMNPIKPSTDVPKMRTRFSMTNQQILDLNDPFNQRTFEDNITRLNHLLQNNQSEYCLINYKGQYPEENEFRLSQNLLSKLVYKDELDLAGNFLQQTVGRRLNDQDMPQLAEFLTKEVQVNRLNFAYNNFGDDAIMILSGVLLVRTDISHVNLAHNDITPSGCSEFLMSLLQRSPLHSLKLAGIKMGQEGFNALICLVMCGRGPYDLDVSETDMSMENFQGLCTAWQAIDRNEDAPKFLLDHPLPIPLEVLAEMKIANNETQRLEYDLIQRRSIVALIRKDAGDMRTDIGMEKIPKIPKEVLADPVALVEKASAIILQGLFEISELQSLEKDEPLEEITLDRGQEKIDAILKKAAKLPNTGRIIEEFKTIKEAGCNPFDDTGRPVIVCPSLYSLEVENILELESSSQPAGGHYIRTPLEDIVMGAQEMAKTGEKSARTPDDETARHAADKVITRVLAEAAKFAGTTDYEDKTDATQILLASVLSTCQKVKDLENSSGEFSDDDLALIWDKATKEAVKLIYNKIPPECCSLTPNAATAFVRKFMESTNRTLLRLLQNPFIPPLIFEAGTAICREVDFEENDTRMFDASVKRNSLTLEDSYIQRIVMSFLEGAVTSAATIIGASDPFSFRKAEHGSLQAVLDTSKDLTEETEGRVVGTVKDFIIAGATLAVDASNVNKKLEKGLDTAIDPAVEYLEEAFDQVANLLIEMEKRRKDLFAESTTKVLEFPFASRCTRLVLNRPIFQDFEAIMASKMGNFLQMNTSVKCLHMRKWSLGENGTESLMDALSTNSTSQIVLLDLGMNQIGPEGAKCLAKFIQMNSNLKHLILNHNRLRNPGLRYISEAFPGSNVQFLNIAYNDIAESLEFFLEILPHTRIRSLYALGNHFNQASWNKLKYLFDTAWLLPDYCDFLLQDVDGNGMIVKNAQIRDVNEWYDVQPIIGQGLYRAPYFEETAHITALMEPIE